MSIVHNALKVAGAVTVVVGAVYVTRKCRAAAKARKETYEAEQLQVGYALKLLRDSIYKELNKSPHKPNDYDRSMWTSVKRTLKNDLSDTPLAQLESLCSWAKGYDQMLRNRNGTLYSK